MTREQRCQTYTFDKTDTIMPRWLKNQQTNEGCKMYSSDPIVLVLGETGTGKELIARVLEQPDWKVSGKDGATEILGLKRSTLRARVQKLGIRKP